MAEPVQRTLMIIKPDIILRHDHFGSETDDLKRILYRITEEGLHIRRSSRHRMSLDQAKLLYKDHERWPKDHPDPERAGKPRAYFPGTIAFMAGYQALFLEVEGPNAIAAADRIKGSTDPKNALPGTIRYIVQSAGGPANVIHASDGPEAAAEEIALVESWDVWRDH